MKRCINLSFLLLLMLTLSCSQTQERAPKPKAVTAVEIPPEIQEILPIINSASAYEVPDLGLQRDENYAKTPQEKPSMPNRDPNRIPPKIIPKL